MAEELEQIVCERCGGLQGLRQRCRTCKGLGHIDVIRTPGHATLSDIRSGRVKDQSRYGLDGDVGPKTTSPIWAGADLNHPGRQ